MRRDHWDKYWDKCPNGRRCCIGTRIVIPDLEPLAVPQAKAHQEFVDPALDEEYWDICPNTRRDVPIRLGRTANVHVDDSPDAPRPLCVSATAREPEPAGKGT